LESISRFNDIFNDIIDAKNPRREKDVNLKGICDFEGGRAAL